MDLTFCTYNCCSFKRNIDIIRDLAAKNIDFIFLQESLVTDNDLSTLDFMDENYKCFSIPAIYSEKCIISNAGRPMGGLVCFYKDVDKFNVELMKYTDDIMIVRVTIDDIKICFVNVYIRSDLGDPTSLSSYLEQLNNIDFMLSEIDYDSVYLVGDFNADPVGGRSWNNLEEFMNRNSFTCFDAESLNSDTFTYISNSSGHQKWLDHIIGRSSNDIVINSMKVLTELIGSDHLPLLGILSLPIPKIDVLPRIFSNANNLNCVNWSSISDRDLDRISFEAAKLQEKYINENNLFCQRYGCSDEQCLDFISKFYDVLVDSVKVSSSNFSKSKIKKDKFKIVPGWNRNVKDKYKVFREKFVTWLQQGKPRNNYLFDNMKIARSDFKRSLDYTLSNRNN